MSSRFLFLACVCFLLQSTVTVATLPTFNGSVSVISKGIVSAPSTGIALSTDGTVLYVPTYDKRVLWTLDLAQHTQTSQFLWTDSCPTGVQFNERDSTLYILGTDTTLEMLNTANDTWSNNPDSRCPDAGQVWGTFAIHPNQRWAYMVESMIASVYGVDLVTGAQWVVVETPLDYLGASGAAVSPDGARLWLAANVNNGLLDIDLRTNEPRIFDWTYPGCSPSVCFFEPPQLVVATPDGLGLFVTVKDDYYTTLLFVDIASHTATVVRTSMAFLTEGGMALDAKRNILYLADWSSNSVLAINIDTNQEIN